MNVLGKWQVAKDASTWVFETAPQTEKERIPHRLQCVQFGCFTHPLQLCIRDAIFKQKSVQELVTRRCEFGGHFKDLAVVVAKILYILDDLCLSYNQLEVGCDHLLEFNPFIYCKTCSKISQPFSIFFIKGTTVTSR